MRAILLSLLAGAVMIWPLGVDPASDQEQVTSAPTSGAEPAYTIIVDPAQAADGLLAGSWVLPIPGNETTLTGLQPFKNIAPDVRRYEENATGVVEVMIEPIRTFSGTFLGADRASVVTVSDDYLGGVIVLECVTYRLVPERVSVLGNDIALAVFSQPEQDCEQGTGVYPGDFGVVMPEPGNEVDVTIEVAMDADASYSEHWGADVFERQVQLMAEAEAAVYKDSGITFEIIEQWRWTSGGPSMGLCSDVHDFNKGHWQGSHANSLKEMLVMLSHNYIEENADGTVVHGCVDTIGGLRDPDSKSFLVSADQLDNVDDLNSIVLAHELGHLLSGLHSEAYENDLDCGHPDGNVDGGSIMRWFLATSCIEPEFSKGVVDSSKNNLERVHACALGPRDSTNCPES